MRLVRRRFALLFVPLTTVALSKIERHLMADAAGLNSLMRQIGGSLGLAFCDAAVALRAVGARRAGVAPGARPARR